MCGALDCLRCFPACNDAPSEDDIERVREELISDCAVEPVPLGQVLHHAFCDDPDETLLHELAAVLRRVLQCNYPEARDSALRAQQRIQDIARREDLFRAEAIAQLKEDGQ